MAEYYGGNRYAAASNSVTDVKSDFEFFLQNYCRHAN